MSSRRESRREDCSGTVGRRRTSESLEAGVFSLFIKWPFLFGRSAGHRPERTLLYDIGTPSEACAPKLVSNGICGERTNWLRTDRNPTGEALH